jgi:cytochrome c5
MSNREFLKSFAGLIAALVALTVIIFIAAQIIGGKARKPESAQADAKAVAERIKPVGEVTVTSSNPVVNAIIPAAQAAGAGAGKKTYDTACLACHAAGVAGAPKFGDKAAWKDRIAQGKDKLYTNAIKGFQGKAGFMPPKGGNASLKDDDVKAATDYMVNAAK